MRRARLSVKPNICITGRGTATLVKLEEKVSKPVTDISQSKEQSAVSETTQHVIVKDAVPTITSKTEKCSPKKHETPASTGGVTSVTKVVQRRSRIKPPVLVTRNRTSTVEVKRSPGDKRVSQSDVVVKSSPVADSGHKVAALQQKSNSVDETDTVLPPHPSTETEDRLNIGVKANHVGDKMQDLVKVSPGSKEEPKHLTSPNAGKAVGSLRRSHFPKARPNLIDTGRHGRTRHPSQSEADEDAGKMLGPPSVQRLASLSPAMTRLVPVSPDKCCSEVFVPPSCVSASVSITASPVKDSCDTSAMEDVVETEPPEDTLNKTLMSKTEKKLVIRRKRRKMEMLAGDVDRSKLTMRDLIYMNPVDNPMKSSVEEAEKKRKTKTEEQVRKQEGDALREEKREEKKDETEAAKSDEDNDDVITLEDEVESVAGSEKVEGGGKEKMKGEEEDDEESLVPQVTIGPDGNIVINQARLLYVVFSLTIETNKTKGREQEDWDIVTEEFSSTSLAYGRKPPARLWKLQETKKFYVALSTVGTDFSLMSNLFPKRSRVELKRKFKREEKQNKHLVETALKERRGFDVTLFEELSSSEEEEVVKGKKKKASKRKGKNEKENQEVQKRRKGEEGGKKKKKKRRSKYYEDSSSESEAQEAVGDDVNPPDTKRPVLEVDEDDRMTLARVESPHPSDEDEAGILKTMCRTTRYGRKPRPIQTYEAPAPVVRKRRPSATPADAVPVASTSHFSSPPHVPARSVIMSPGRDMFARSPSGQLISLTNLGQSSPVAEMAGSQFVFVTSPPKPNADGTMSTSPQVIHVYLVSNTSATPPGGVAQVLPCIEPSSETTSVTEITTAHISDAPQVLPCQVNSERSPASQNRT